MISHDVYAATIRGACRRAAAVYRATVDDLTQEVYANFYDPAFQRRLEEVPEGGDRARYVLGMARRTAALAGQKEKADREGFAASDIYVYGPNEVAELIGLARMLRVDGRLPQAPAGRSGAPQVRSEGGDTLASVVDVLSVIERMPDDDRLFLFMVDETGGDIPLIAASIGADPKSVAQRHRRLVRKLTGRLNDYRRAGSGTHDGPGSRRAVSNARAVARTRRSNGDQERQ